MGKLKYYLAFVAIQLLILTVNGYVITTSRKWTSGENNKVCVTLKSSATPKDHLEVGVKAKESEEEYLLPMKPFSLVPGKLSICGNLALNGEHQTSGDLVVEGKLGGVELKYSKPILIVNVNDAFKTIVQTDKFIYKPLQTVHFRILSFYGPFLNVSTERYEEILVDNPSGTRVAQWSDVSNEKGLIHKSFQLSDEAEEGTYKIHVRPRDKKLKTQTFKVEEYVLPKYEVDIESSEIVIKDPQNIGVEVCAKYGSGQSVKGQLNFTIYSEHSKPNMAYILSPIFGCKKISMNETELGIIIPSYGQFKLQALVKEDDTGIEIKSNEKSISVTTKFVSFDYLWRQTFLYRKPGLPYIAEVQTSIGYDQPARHEPFKACVGVVCKNFTSNADGILKFAVPPHLNSNIEITSWNYGSNYKNLLSRHNSPSDSSLLITPEEAVIDCAKTSSDIKFEVPIHFVTKEQDKALLSVQVVSHGQILYSKTFEQAFQNGSWIYFDESLLLEPLLPPADDHVRGFFILPVILPKTASPEAKLIVWYTRDDGEIVADSKILSIAECFSNGVSLSFDSKTSHPGEPAGISLRAEPNSLCSLGVVDKNVGLHSSGSSPLTLKAVREPTEEYCRRPTMFFGSIDDALLREQGCTFSINRNENNQIDDQAYCYNLRRKKLLETREKRNVKIPGTHDYPPQFDQFPTPVVYDYTTDGLDALHMFNDAGLYVFTNQTVESRSCRNRRNRGKRSARDEDYSRQISSQSTANKIPAHESTTGTYFPETWLWDLVKIGDNGEAGEQFTLPDTVTEWTGSAVCVHPSKGLGFSNKASIATFQDFSVDLVLPTSSTVGEIMPVKILIFNNIKKSIPIHIILKPSSEYEIVTLSRNSKIAAERSSCVSSKSKIVHTILIKPIAVGEVNITVVAQVDTNSIESCGDRTGKFRTEFIVKPILVKFEGAEEELVQSKYICVKETYGDRIASRIVRTLTPPPGIVPGSARGFAVVVGNIMGPTVENLEPLLINPVRNDGKHELNFGSSIFVMKYLESSNQKKKLPVEKAMNYIEEGKKFHLAVRNEGGSFGFGRSTGNTRLTAFLLKCFAHAKNFIFVDEKDLKITKVWLKKRFSFYSDDGCFTNPDGKARNNVDFFFNSQDKKFRLTSYVLISLFESGENASDFAVRRASPCLKAGIKSEHPYTLALGAYALALAEDPDSVSATEKLLSLATISSSEVYWELPFESGSSDGLIVETAGYAVLALLKLNKKYPNEDYLKYVTKIVSWINANWKTQRGLVPSQDTIVVLQALAEYHKEVPRYPFRGLTVHVEVNRIRSRFLINEDNKHLQQKTPVSKFPADISFDIEGTGCVLLQAIAHYNVPLKHVEPIEPFNITVEIESIELSFCGETMKICVSSLLEDQASYNGIIDVKVVSGYIPSFDYYPHPLSEIQNIQGYDYSGDQLTFYVSKLTRQPTCLTFDVFGRTVVENPDPGIVKVYNQHKPQHFVTEKYVLPHLGKCLRELEDNLGVVKV